MSQNPFSLRNLGLAAVTLGVAGVIAAGPLLAETAIESRQALMKTNVAAVKAASAMVKGEVEYDPVKAELAMRAIHAAATGLPHLFPEDSKTGGDTRAAPKIWEDLKGFLHLAEELREHSATAIEAAKQGPEAFKAEFAATVKYCSECHQTYRLEKK